MIAIRLLDIWYGMSNNVYCDKCGIEKNEWEQIMYSTHSFRPEMGMVHHDFCDGNWRLIEEK